ncbi:hypothetical protein [Noviherbaspirillum autotrophicum]|uniref:Uncharacterized protein n=1 Tax=Noviherbaspirillum autotrophicum TaxID=709839 RepID=A0A0C2BW74_9BURK|nr:hypothetical protein [Noviherbaspirillum autotrophicum]KIF82276.1 hypothetical protein TSA66_18035 [Noviherbaspirillum autotrophicum]
MGKTQGRVQAISEKLCEEFLRAVPLHPAKLKRGKKLSESEIQAFSEAALKDFYEVARSERQRHRLGVIGRARVAFGLQQRLLQAGYPAPLVKQVLFAMLATVFVG